MSGTERRDSAIIVVAAIGLFIAGAAVGGLLITSFSQPHAIVVHIDQPLQVRLVP